jgi:N-acetylmuramoyl-L-alanine amidase
MVLTIALLLSGFGGGSAPSAITITSPGGERRIAVRMDPRSGPMLPAGALLEALKGTAASDGIWADVQLGAAPFRFLVGAALVSRGGQFYPLAAPARAIRDSLFLPLQFVTEALPRLQAERFRYDPGSARLTDLGAPATRSATPVTARVPTTAPPRARRVTIDPGHGGVDPGNPGRYFPAGIREKEVNLQVGLLVRDELQRRGIEVTMTRTRDTLIDLGRRGSYCSDECDLFVSIHVNSLPRRMGYTDVRGFETYIMAEARTEDAARVARMENEAVRFEASSNEVQAGGLDFILKDLQLNEYLREAARAAELVQSSLRDVHSGPDRGVKHAPLMVLNTARRPAILVELGFATNRADAVIMSGMNSQRRLAVALAEAIENYLNEFGRRTGASSGGSDGR